MATETMPRTPGTPRQAPGRRTPPGPPTPGPPARPRPARPVSAPRHTRPVTRPATGPATGLATGPATAPLPRRSRGRSPRAPFILLLVGLLGGALVSLLVISTTLAQGAFQITNLQQQNASLARQEQTLSDAVAQAGNPAVIARKAAQLGMRQNPHLRFYDAKTGKIVSGQVTKSEAAINVPGYAP